MKSPLAQSKERKLPNRLRHLRQARQRRNLALAEAASLLNLSASGLSRLERGQRALPVLLFERMCSLYHIHPWALLQGRLEPAEFDPPPFPPGTRFKRIRLFRGYTLVRLGKLLGIAPSTLSLLENGRRRLTVSLLQRTLDSLRVDYSDFFTRSPLLLVKRPVTGTAAAGEPAMQGIRENVDGMEAVFPAASKGNLLAFEIDGDSMSPYYIPGDIVLFRPGLVPKQGDIVVARLEDGSHICKRMGKTERDYIMLESFNPAFSTITVPARSLAACWRVVGSWRTER